MLGRVFVDVWGVVPVGSGLGLALDLRLGQGLEGLSNLPPLNRAPDRTALFWPPIHEEMVMHMHTDGYCWIATSFDTTLSVHIQPLPNTPRQHNL